MKKLVTICCFVSLSVTASAGDIALSVQDVSHEKEVLDNRMITTGRVFEGASNLLKVVAGALTGVGGASIMSGAHDPSASIMGTALVIAGPLMASSGGIGVALVTTEIYEEERVDFGKIRSEINALIEASNQGLIEKEEGSNLYNLVSYFNSNKEESFEERATAFIKLLVDAREAAKEVERGDLNTYLKSGDFDSHCNEYEVKEENRLLFANIVAAFAD